jgi:hypothetical protein
VHPNSSGMVRTVRVDESVQQNAFVQGPNGSSEARTVRVKQVIASELSAGLISALQLSNLLKSFKIFCVLNESSIQCYFIEGRHMIS